MGLSFPLGFFPPETLELPENLGKLELKLGLKLQELKTLNFTVCLGEVFGDGIWGEAKIG